MPKAHLWAPALDKQGVAPAPSPSSPIQSRCTNLHGGRAITSARANIDRPDQGPAFQASASGWLAKPRLLFAAHDLTEIGGERGHVDAKRAFTLIPHEPATPEPSHCDGDV